MARRRYLVAYDIRDERRLRAVATCSVFVCDLSAREFVLMRGSLERLMLLSADSVMVVDLGLGEDQSRFLFLGQHERLPSITPVVV